MQTSALPSQAAHAPRCGPVRRSKRGIYRAAALIAVHLAVIAHVAHWKVSGSTLTPVEPSEAAQTLELGYVNAGFLFFGAMILLTLVVGRFFCGWACHVVAYQDLCAWLLAKVGLRPRPVRSRLLLFAPLVAVVLMFVWPQVERWIAGRAGPDGLSWHLTTADLWRTFPGPGIAALTFAVDGFLLVWLLGAKGFCTYGCPYGAIFGLADRAAPGRIRVTDACEGCGHCTATCTSNVRVHEEVALHGMVVDPGCMKCMDCVSVCPKDALYFGFGKPAPRSPAPKRRKRVYDFTWPEEIAMAAIFGVALFAFYRLYNRIPLLLAVGLAVVAAIAGIVGLRALRRRDFSFQRAVLRAGGRWRPAGIAAVAVAAGSLALVAHSAVVQGEGWRAERLFREAGRARGEERARLVGESLERLRSLERLSLVEVAALHLQIGQLHRDRGEWDEAERRMRLALESDARMIVPRVELAWMRKRRGDVAGARAELEAALAVEPEHPAVKKGLADLAGQPAR